MNKAKVNSTEEVYSSDWLSLKRAIWQKSDGEVHSWEYVGRLQCDNIVMMIPVFKNSGKYVIVRQFRPPIGKYTYEFPAGLVESKEDICLAAIRELKEETGYTGVITKTYPDRAVSAGLCSEVITVFKMEIDENSIENINPIQNLDPGEELDVLILTLEEMKDLVLNSNNDVLVDAKLSMFCSGCLA